jgi:hypothetical protein
VSNSLAYVAQTTAEPAPSGWTQAGELALRHAEQQPNVVFPLLAIGGLLAIIVGAAYVFVKHWLPAWRAEQQANRENYKAEKQADREHLGAIVAGERALAKEQQASIVERIGAEVQRLTGEFSKIGDRFDRHGEVLRSVAAKVGATLLVLLVLLLAGCLSKLPVQQTLAERVHKATLACVKAPAGALKARVCADALLCQSTAETAAKALQDAQKATATGQTDVTKEAAAAGQVVLADVACKRGGW